MKYCPECKGLLHTKQLDGVERQLCQVKDCGFVVWDNPVPVVAGLILYKNKILLARNSAWPEGMFSLIAGYLERFESPANAIIREVQEELGLKVSKVQFIGHYPFREKNQLIIAYQVLSEGTLVLNDEIIETELLDIKQLKQKDFGALDLTKAIVADWISSQRIL